MDCPSAFNIETFSSEHAELSCALSNVTLPCVVLVRGESRGAQSAVYENVDTDLYLHGNECAHGEKDNMRFVESSNQCCSSDELIHGSVIALFEKSLIQTVRLRILKFDTPARQELTHGREFVQQHNEQVGHEVRIPLKYKGKVRLHSSVKRGKRYFNISQVIKDFPPCIRVEEELTVIKDNGQGCIVLPRGLRLILIKVDSSFEEMGQNTVLVCRCDSSEISLPSICKGHFTASMDDSDYTLQEIVDQFSVPKTVTFNKLNLKDFISISELDNDRLFNALSGPVEIEAVENIESYIGCEHQTSVNIKYNIVVLPTFLNPSVHLPKDVVNTNKLLKEYFVKPTVKLVTFIESNLFSFGSVSRVPIYLRFPGSEKSAVKDDLTNNENETNLSCPLYDSPSASTLPGKPLCSKDTGPHPTRIITRKEGVRRRIVQAEQSMQRLSVTEPVLATTIDNKQRVGYEGQRSVDPGAGKQLELYPGNSRQVLQNADKPQLMSGYTALFRDVDDYDMAAEDTNVYEPIDINDDEYEYVSVPQETSSLTSPSEVKEDATDLPVTGSPGYGCYAVLPRENSVGITPTYENVDKNQITVNKETVASGDQPKHSTLDLNYTSQKAALYENVT